MRRNLLILAGTSEATRLAQVVSEAGIPATLSYAGRVERTKAQPLPKRIGGFGGVAGLIEYLREAEVSHVIDATHPFAAQMSRNAVDACAAAGIPLVALTRSPWIKRAGDLWTSVYSIDAAVSALPMSARSVLLAIGRMHLNSFAERPQHHYILRLVDPPASDILLPSYQAIVSRGPFTLEGDRQLMQEHAIDFVVSKNAGGAGSRSKIDAARDLGLPVIMIERPILNRERLEFERVEDVMQWLFHASTDLGV